MATKDSEASLAQLVSCRQVVRVRQPTSQSHEADRGTIDCAQEENNDTKLDDEEEKRINGTGSNMEPTTKSEQIEQITTCIFEPGLASTKGYRQLRR